MDTYVQLFLDYLEYERGYSPLTIKAYQHDLNRFISFLNSSGSSSLEDLQYSDIRLYLAHLNEYHLKRSTISRHLSSLRSFFNFCIKQGYLTNDPTELVEYQSKKQRLPEFFYEEEMEAIIHAAQTSNNPLKLRNLAIIELLYATGIRISELCNLTLPQVDLQIQMIRVIGKGNKERIVPVGDQAIEVLQKYIEELRPSLLNTNSTENISNNQVFLSDKGKGISSDQVRKILQDVVEEGALHLNIHPHKFRHTFATHLLNHGADIRSVQELLGHSDLSSTQIYTHVTKDKLRQTYLSIHPRAKRDTRKDEDL